MNEQQSEQGCIREFKGRKGKGEILRILNCILKIKKDFKRKNVLRYLHKQELEHHKTEFVQSNL